MKAIFFYYILSVHPTVCSGRLPVDTAASLHHLQQGLYVSVRPHVTDEKVQRFASLHELLNKSEIQLQKDTNIKIFWCKLELQVVRLVVTLMSLVP